MVGASPILGALPDDWMFGNAALHAALYTAHKAASDTGSDHSTLQRRQHQGQSTQRTATSDARSDDDISQPWQHQKRDAQHITGSDAVGLDASSDDEGSQRWQRQRRGDDVEQLLELLRLQEEDTVGRARASGQSHPLWHDDSGSDSDSVDNDIIVERVNQRKSTGKEVGASTPVRPNRDLLEASTVQCLTF